MRTLNFYLNILLTYLFIRVVDCNLSNLTATKVRISFIEEPRSTFTIDPFINAAFGTVENKTWILGGEISSGVCNHTRFIDRNTYKMSYVDVEAPSPLTLWSDSTTQTNDAIYYTSAEDTRFYKFDTKTTTYSILESVPDGNGLSCLVSYQNPNDNLWYIYSLGGTWQHWWPLLNKTYMYNVSSNKWKLMSGQMKIRRVQHSCAIADSNSITNQVRIYVFGGKTGVHSSSNNTIEYCVLDIENTNMINSNCILINDTLIQNKQETQTFQFNDHLIFIMGGKKNEDNSIDEIEILDINTNKIYHNTSNSSTLNLLEPRAKFVYFLDESNGIFYIWGGLTIDQGARVYVDYWEIGCFYQQTTLISQTPDLCNGSITGLFVPFSVFV